MKLQRALPWALAVALLAVFGWKLHTSHFDWHGFGRSLSTANMGLIALAILVIYSNNVIRALRWSVFLRPAFRAATLRPVPWSRLIASQFIGFTGLAIFGRIGELIRPLLVARRTGLSFPSQVAVVTVERVFDLAAFALIFAGNLLLSPGLSTLPYLHRAGYSIAGLTLFLCLFVLGVRVAGATLAEFCGGLVAVASKPAGAKVAEKILGFRDGLNVIDSLRDFALAAALSLALWGTIALSYVLTLRAFPPPVHTLSAASIIVLMGFSIAGSALPIPGGSGAWAGNVFALTNLLHIPAELAAGAGLAVWLVTSMSVIPAGLVCAQRGGISLTELTRSRNAVQSDT